MTQNIDKIIYINLEHRTDRRAEIEGELNKFGLQYERFNAFYTKGFGTLGCLMSHLGVIKIAKQNNYKNILILEDDFTFLVSKEEFEDKLCKFFELYPESNFDVCMIGYNMRSFQELDNSVVNKVLDAQTTSGYIVNNHYYDKLINIFESSIEPLIKTHAHWLYACDQIWKNLQKIDNWYYFKTRIGKQRPSYSDNSESFAEYPDC